MVPPEYAMRAAAVAVAVAAAVEAVEAWLQKHMRPLGVDLNRNKSQSPSPPEFGWGELVRGREGDPTPYTTHGLRRPESA